MSRYESAVSIWCTLPLSFDRAQVPRQERDRLRTLPGILLVGESGSRSSEASRRRDDAGQRLPSQSHMQIGCQGWYVSILGLSKLSADKTIERPARRASSRKFPKSLITRVQLIRPPREDPERQFATFAHDLATPKIPAPARRGGHKSKFSLARVPRPFTSASCSEVEPTLYDCPQCECRQQQQLRVQHLRVEV